MDYGLMLKDLESFYILLEEERPSMFNLLTLAFFFSLSLGILHGVNSYVLGYSKFNYLVDVAVLSMQGQGYSLEDIGVVLWGFEADILNSSIDMGLFTFAGKLSETLAISSILYLIMRLLGSSINFIKVLQVMVSLLIIPVVVFAFPVLLNVVSYHYIGNISLLNTVVTSAFGWVIYYVTVGERLKFIGALDGRRARMSVAPLSVMVALNIIWPVWWIYFHLFAVNNAVEVMFNSFGI
ncbi:MAG: hypothetical protein GF416_06060 [Candidatus Altiarchaeales archaeon]|nr:hypothetical protein [Candidatus Altiarchaeales archaeon]MBD3416680.1 hypothetical protein [Candidatus Altiarchaeales archaeon]